MMNKTEIDTDNKNAHNQIPDSETLEHFKKPIINNEPNSIKNNPYIHIDNEIIISDSFFMFSTKLDL